MTRLRVLRRVLAALPGAAQPDDDGPARVARTTRRLAVLLGAGVAPGSAWRHLALEADASDWHCPNCDCVALASRY